MKSPHWTLGWGAAIGLALGIALAGGRGPIRAGGVDRVEGSVLAAARIAVQQHPTNRTSTPQDALYYLDYKAGRLLAAVPSYRQLGTQVSVLGEFASRDLVTDFRLEPGVTPHFTLAAADLGVSHAGSAVFVVETTTRRIATYLAEIQGAGPRGELAPKIQLIELRDLP